MDNHEHNTPGTWATCARCGSAIRWNENGGWMAPHAPAYGIARCDGATLLHYPLADPTPAMDTYTVLVHLNLTVQASTPEAAMVEARFYNTVHGIAGDVAGMDVL